jgi:hypothetical protein
MTSLNTGFNCERPCEGSCFRPPSEVKVGTGRCKNDKKNCRPITAQTTRLKNDFEVICLKISSHMHYAFNNSQVLEQPVHIPTCFGGGHHYHHQGIHLANQNTAVRTVRIVMHWQRNAHRVIYQVNTCLTRRDFEGLLQQALSSHTQKRVAKEHYYHTHRTGR